MLNLSNGLTLDQKKAVLVEFAKYSKLGCGIITGKTPKDADNKFQVWTSGPFKNVEILLAAESAGINDISARMRAVNKPTETKQYDDKCISTRIEHCIGSVYFTNREFIVNTIVDYDSTIICSDDFTITDTLTIAMLVLSRQVIKNSKQKIMLKLNKETLAYMPNSLMDFQKQLISLHKQYAEIAIAKEAWVEQQAIAYKELYETSQIDEIDYSEAIATIKSKAASHFKADYTVIDKEIEEIMFPLCVSAADKIAKKLVDDINKSLPKTVTPNVIPEIGKAKVIKK